MNSIFEIKRQNEDLLVENAVLLTRLAEVERVKMELYWLYEALCEKLNQGGWVQVKPPNLSIVRDSQVKK